MRSIRFLPAIFLIAIGTASASVTTVASLPSQLTVYTMQSDSAGNLYIAGSAPNPHPGGVGTPGAFVAKLSSDGSTVQFLTTLAGSGFDMAKAIAIAPDGAILVAGQTSSPDFPITPGAAQTTNPSSGIGGTGFFARLDPKGNVTYASFLNATASGAQQSVVNIIGIASDASGNAYITGQGLFTSTAGALQAVQYFGSGFFVIKLDTSGKTVFATGAVGGTHIALDSQGAIYIAGSERSGYPIPISSSAFQSTTQDTLCGSVVGSPDGGISFNCQHQYVVKLNPTAASLVYSTWLTGTYGASIASFAVDGQGNAVVAGTTESTDYPVTPGAFQTANFATLPPLSNVISLIPVGIAQPGPAATGYVTKLNATGTGLVFSTFLGGSAQDSITNLTLDSTGNIDLAGYAHSPDFPGLTPGPAPCHPGLLYAGPFFTRLSADGSAITETQVAYGLNVQTSSVSGPRLAAFPAAGKAAILSGTTVVSMDSSTASSGLACAADSADMNPLTQIAPGQLLSLFGTGIGATTTAVGQPQNSQMPTTVNGNTVSFNGIAAPILYSSPGQINVQVPYEISGQPMVQMKIAGGAAAASRQFPLITSQPTAFTIPGYAACQSTRTNALLPLVMNADGTQNSCTNRAAAGSTVTLFVNGVGPIAGQSTGAISSSATPLGVPVTVNGDVSVVSAESAPGSINAVWQVQVNISQVRPQHDPGVSLAVVNLTINGVNLRDSLVIWTKPAGQ